MTSAEKLLLLLVVVVLSLLSSCGRNIATAQAQPYDGNDMPLMQASSSPVSNSCPVPATTGAVDVTLPGCACIINQQLPQQKQGNNSTSSRQGSVCPAGYRCSASAAAAIVAVGWKLRAAGPADASSSLFNSSTTRLKVGGVAFGICTPCLFGEFCPEGTQEVGPFAIPTCHSDPTQGATNTHTGSCTRVGFNACPEGMYCPNASVAKPCEAGRWCAEGSTASDACSIENLLAWNPFRHVRPAPRSLLDALVSSGLPLAGNSCPANSSSPMTSCKAGSYCPDASTIVTCPAGYFCPANSRDPTKCPPLANCHTEGSAAPQWSWEGLLMMVLLLVLLLVGLEYLRVAKRGTLRGNSLEDEVMLLIAAVGFQVTSARFQGSCSIQQTPRSRRQRWMQRISAALSSSTSNDSTASARPAAPRGSTSAELSDLGNLYMGAQATPGSNQAATLVHNSPRGLSGMPVAEGRIEDDQQVPPLPAVTTPAVGAASVATSDKQQQQQQQQLQVSAVMDDNVADASFVSAHHSMMTSALGSLDDAISDPLPAVMDAAMDTEQRPTMSDHSSAVLAATAPTAAAAAAAAAHQYKINPRITLIFSHVWVSDRPMTGTLGLMARRALQAAKRQKAGVSAIFSRASAPEDPADAADELAAAAAENGAKFIVPGISGRFPATQLHAIFGPSGCGKTTLCKALSGRLPATQVVGDIRIVCSSGDQPAAEPSAPEEADASAGISLAAADAAFIMGFVPQDDLLHDTLTVAENLEIAARLRLPINSSKNKVKVAKGGDSFINFSRQRWFESGHRSTISRHQRRKEVQTVVDDVLSLMDLSKVANQLVGASVSGGQRKRAAIGVELVAKPSLLFLDEPTSGLDSAIAADVVGALKQSSLRGMNVLAIMHQPRLSIFNMFDTCTVLGAGGHMVFAGPQVLALDYLAFLGFRSPPGENVADFLLDVTAGVVSRPGDPDFVPSQLPLLWQQTGSFWIKEYLDQQPWRALLEGQRPHQGLEDSANLVDWPWRPRDLEALQLRFNQLAHAAPVDCSSPSSTAGSNAAAIAAAMHHPLAPYRPVPLETHGAEDQLVMDYDSFKAFFNADGLREVLGEDRYTSFMEGLCKDFNMQEGATITQRRFMKVLKQHMCAAAALHQGPANSFSLQQSSNSLLGDSLFIGPPVTQESMGPSLILPPAQGSVRPSDMLQERGSTVPGLLTSASMRLRMREHQQHQHQLHGRQSLSTSLGMDWQQQQQQQQLHNSTSALVEQAGGPAGVARSRSRAKSLADIARQVMQRQQQEAAARAAAADSMRSSLPAVRPSAAVAIAAHQSASAQQAAAAQAGYIFPDDDQHQSSRTAATAAVPAGDQAQAHGTPLVLDVRNIQQHYVQGHEVDSDTRAVPGTAALSAGQFADSNTGSGTAAPVGEAPADVARVRPRARSLADIAREVMQRQHQQQEAAARAAAADSTRATSPDVTVAAAHQSAAAHQQLAAAAAQSGYITSNGDKHHSSRSAAAAAAGDQAQGKPVVLDIRNIQQHYVQGHVVDSDTRAVPGTAALSAGLYADSNNGSGTAAEAASAGSAAVMLSGRRLPSLADQLWLVVLRCGKKWVSSRGALMTDLLLVALLGLALGVAQGHSAQPSESVLWLLITLLAYGCMALARSINSFGEERHLYLQQESPGGVAAASWVFGHQLFDLLGLFLQPALFFAWLYVLTLPAVSALTYYFVLVSVGWYTSGIGYLVSLMFAPKNTLLAGLAAALLLGGVANGVAPKLWSLSPYNPLTWLDQLSYTRWGLQALYIDWLTPAKPAMAPATAAFLGSMGFCGLDPHLMQQLQIAGNDDADSSGHRNILLNTTTGNGTKVAWLDMNGAQRADAMAAAAADKYQQEKSSSAAAAAALTQLWQYYNRPELLSNQCQRHKIEAFAVLLGLGLVLRLLLLAVVRFKVVRKKGQ